MIRIGNLYVYLKNYIMKFTKLTIAFLSVFFCLVVACGSDGINDDPKTPDVTEPVTPNEPDEPDNPSVVKVPTLQKNGKLILSMMVLFIITMNGMTM